jgi:hypothetical protein
VGVRPDGVSDCPTPEVGVHPDKVRGREGVMLDWLKDAWTESTILRIMVRQLVFSVYIYLIGISLAKAPIAQVTMEQNGGLFLSVIAGGMLVAALFTQLTFGLFSAVRYGAFHFSLSAIAMLVMRRRKVRRVP